MNRLHAIPKRPMGHWIFRVILLKIVSRAGENRYRAKTIRNVSPLRRARARRDEQMSFQTRIPRQREFYASRFVSQARQPRPPLLFVEVFRPLPKMRTRNIPQYL